MGRRAKVSPVLKQEAVLRYQRGESSLAQLAAAYGVSQTSLREWLSVAPVTGTAGFETAATNQRYPADFKRQAVNAYLEGEGSFLTISAQMGIRSKTQLQRWVAALISWATVSAITKTTPPPSRNITSRINRSTAGYARLRQKAG